MTDGRDANDESGLVARAIAGDTDAFGELYLLYLDAIYRYVFFRVCDPEDAEDLTEHVFLKAWEGLPRYKDCGNPFSSWLYRIAHNSVVDHHRRKKPTVPIAQVSGDQLDNPKQANLLKQVIELEENAALAFAISQLPEEQQQVIVLRFIEGLNHASISRIIDKSEGACRMIQYRALSALNQLLQCVRE